LHFISVDTFLGLVNFITLTPVNEIEPIMTTSVPYKNSDDKARAMIPHRIDFWNLFYQCSFSYFVYGKMNIMCIDRSHKMRIYI